jgi:hypothetical protein
MIPATTFSIVAYRHGELDAILFPANDGSEIAAKAGYPSVEVRAGFTSGAGDRPAPDYPNIDDSVRPRVRERYATATAMHTLSHSRLALRLCVQT